MNVNKKVTPQTQKPIRFLMLDIIRRDWKQNANMLMCIQVWLMLKHIMTFIFMAMKQKQKKVYVKYIQEQFSMKTELINFYDSGICLLLQIFV